MVGWQIIRGGIRRDPTLLEKIFRTVLAIGVPTLIRYFVDGGAYGLPIVMYLPSILMIAVYLGWRWGTVTAVGTLLVVLFVLPPITPPSLARAYAVSMLLFMLCGALMVLIGEVLRTLTLELDRRAVQTESFNQELLHRTRNSLQMMRSLASRASRATDPASFYEALSGRLDALLKANELLRFGALEASDMKELVDAAIKPFNTEQIQIRGPNCRVSRDGCTPLVMALHELGTNATKYGALSRADGKVELVWQPLPKNRTIELTWRESGGPQVVKPTHRGLGTRLLAPNGGLLEVDLDFRPEGLVCRMNVAEAEEPGSPRVGV